MRLKPDWVLSTGMSGHLARTDFTLPSSKLKTNDIFYNICTWSELCYLLVWVWDLTVHHQSNDILSIPKAPFHSLVLKSCSGYEWTQRELSLVVSGLCLFFKKPISYSIQRASDILSALRNMKQGLNASVFIKTVN